MAPSYYPLEEDSDEKPVPTTVRLPAEVHADVELMRDLWNEMDAALGKEKSRKWRSSSVMERLVCVGVDGFWSQVGGRPTTKEGRADFIRQAIEKLRSAKK